MSLAPWRSPLARALHRNRSLVYSRYVQLATVRANGQPANRTIVFRGFLDDSNQLRFVTDDRSDKTDQIQQNPWGEICWYFPNTREQFRLFGTLQLIDANSTDTSLKTAREKIWQELSSAARLQFAWAHPGKPRNSADSFQPADPDATTPLTNFCLLLLNPTQVDHLELRGNPQNRWIYQLDSEQNWSTTEVNP
jgi:pyridoxamine 5'-phosphate oxidase